MAKAQRIGFFMASQDDRLSVTMTREEIERLVQILNTVYQRDSDVEHFLILLQKALHYQNIERVGIKKPS